MRLDRPVGSLLLLWPTLAALWMAADGTPTISLVVIFTLGTLLMRSAGCVINDYVDRDVDGKVERTKDRPLATGVIQPQHALMLFFALAASAGLLVLLLNRQTQYLAVGGLLIAAAYPFMKRWTYLPQVMLGAAFSWGILMAWTATGHDLVRFAEEGVVMFIGSVLWIVAYDTMYAMVDREDDILIGVKSTAILFGHHDRLVIAILQASALLAFFLLGQQLEFSHAYYLGLAVIAALFIYQQVLIRNRDTEKCFKAFTNNILVGFALFVGTLSDQYLSMMISS
ncbi:MAG: 4-hydroxybenzoate octaprenyltransferase [Gammaproteobacteria bacterium]|nr:4-hydroxybenzoate octaprenyltransferase [Gammaproteobacteria bacterium]